MHVISALDQRVTRELPAQSHLIGPIRGDGWRLIKVDIKCATSLFACMHVVRRLLLLSHSFLSCLANKSTKTTVNGCMAVDSRNQSDFMHPCKLQILPENNRVPFPLGQFLNPPLRFWFFSCLSGGISSSRVHLGGINLLVMRIHRKLK